MPATVLLVFCLCAAVNSIAAYPNDYRSYNNDFNTQLRQPVNAQYGSSSYNDGQQANTPRTLNRNSEDQYRSTGNAYHQPVNDPLRASSSYYGQQPQNPYTLNSGSDDQRRSPSNEYSQQPNVPHGSSTNYNGQQVNVQHAPKNIYSNSAAAKRDQNDSGENVALQTSDNVDRNFESEYSTTSTSFTTPFQPLSRTKSPTTHPTFFCSHSTLYFDCKIQNVKLKKYEMAKLGSSNRQNTQTNITFENSWMEYLPKTLVDAFPSMKLLNLNDLRIESIEERAFSSGRTLYDLYMDNNRLTKIPPHTFEGAFFLETLTLSNNEITYVDNLAFRNNRKLKNLYLDFNQINTLPSLIDNGELRVLNASHNHLQSINDDQFESNKHMEYVDVSFNQLTHFDLMPLKNLFNLYSVNVKQNKLQELFIPASLKQVNAENNSIHSLTTDIRGCSVDYLNLALNNMTTTPILTTCYNLQYLDLSHNLLEEFDLFKNVMSKLSYLNLANNHLYTITLTGTPALKVLDLSNNRLSFLPKKSSLGSLASLQLHGNHLIQFDFTPLTQLRGVSLAHNEWDCASINPILDRATDRHDSECAHGFTNSRGICCKAYNKPYNHRVNMIISEAFFHQFQIKERQREICPAQQTAEYNPGHNSDLRQAAATADSNSKAVLDQTIAVKDAINKVKQDMTSSIKTIQTFSVKQNNLIKELENQRVIYDVEKEGLISGKTLFETVLKFVRDRNEFLRDSLGIRKDELAKTERQISDLNTEKAELEGMHQQINEQIAQIKIMEKKLKTEKDKLEKQANKNAASIHGATGKVTK